MEKDIIKVRESRHRCKCEDDCECLPELFVTVNGKMGYGNAVGVFCNTARKTVYSCNFLGMQFLADDIREATDRLRNNLGPLNNVEVKFSLT